jgi:hypothetical protein
MTVPFPLPLVPELMVSQVWFRVAVQLQPGCAATVTELCPAVPVGFADVGATEKVQGPDEPA